MFTKHDPRIPFHSYPALRYARFWKAVGIVAICAIIGNYLGAS